MFEGNILTFNPFWDADVQPVTSFEGVRVIQISWRPAGLALTRQTDDASTGPASFLVTDPGASTLMFDRNVPAPEENLP